MARRTAATAALAGWVLAVPVLLVQWGGWPLDGAPGWAALRDLPVPDPADQVALGVLSTVLWGIWGQLAWSIAVELRAAGRPGLRRERPTDPIRRFAAHLVGAVRHRPEPVTPAPVAAPEPGPEAPAVPTTAGASEAVPPAGTPDASQQPSGPPGAPHPEPDPRLPAGTASARRQGSDASPPAGAPASLAGSGRLPGADAGDDGPVSVRGLISLLAQVDVLVRVLGPVDAVWPDLSRSPLSESRIVPVRQKALEALVFLALSDVGVTRQELTQALFPDGVESERHVYKAVHQVQKVVGHQPPPAAAGRHLLLPEQVATDYGLFCDLLVQARTTGDRAVTARLLDEALDLVRGEPFSGISRGYVWAAPHRDEMVARVTAAAQELAELSLAADDPDAAEAAARRGLRAAPEAAGLERFATTTSSEA